MYHNSLALDLFYPSIPFPLLHVTRYCGLPLHTTHRAFRVRSAELPGRSQIKLKKVRERYCIRVRDPHRSHNRKGWKVEVAHSSLCHKVHANRKNASCEFKRAALWIKKATCLPLHVRGRFYSHYLLCDQGNANGRRTPLFSFNVVSQCLARFAKEGSCFPKLESDCSQI